MGIIIYQLTMNSVMLSVSGIGSDEIARNRAIPEMGNFQLLDYYLD
jgi:hypothetical protein